MCVYIGIRNDVIAVLGDVSIVHPIEGVKPYKCASGAVVRRLKQKKDRQTVRTNAPQEQRRRKEQWCVDSSKRRTVRPYVQRIRNHDTLLVHSDVLGDVRQTWTRLHRVPHHHRGDSGETQRGFTTLSIRNAIHATAMRQQCIARQLRRYKRQISFVRVRGMANRIKSAMFAVGKSNITGQASQQQMNAGHRQLAPPGTTPHPTE